MRSRRSPTTSFIASSSGHAASRDARDSVLLPQMSPPRVGMAALGKNFEAQRARDRRGLDEPHRDAIAEAVGLAAAGADERVAGPLVTGKFPAECAPRDQAVRRRILQPFG